MRKPDEITDSFVKKEFTDRNASRKLFWKWYEKASAHRDDFFVLSYYGIGGIGKSSLLNQLCRELTDRSGLYVKFDFESAKGLEPFNVLIGLKQSIHNKYGSLFQFPLMNAALLMMAKKSDLDFKNDELVRSTVAESPYFGQAVDALALVPIVGAPINFVIKFWSQLSADLENLANNKSLKEKYRQAMDEMKYLEADELRKKMPQYFRIDMTENIRHLSMPLVLFLDTYEKYIDTFKASSNIVLDSWLWEGPQSLIQRIPGILWVISGRDKLTWEDAVEWDAEHLTCSEVQDFLNLDSIKYLHTAGITDEKLIAHICTITEGVPIYLELCVDTYYLIKSRGKVPAIENFDVNKLKIANRYVKYLDHVNRTLVHMLAAMGSWRDDEAEYVGKNAFSGMFPAELYTAIIQHSFIKTDEDGKRRMHNIVIDSLLSGINSSTLNAVNADLFHYRIIKLNNIKFSSDVPSAVDDAVHCFCKISLPKIYKDQYSDFRKLTTRIKEIRKKGFIFESLSFSTTLNEHCAAVFQNTDYYAESLLIQADSLWSAGYYRQALENDELSYSLRQASLGINHPDTLTSLYSLGVDYSDLGKFEDALDIKKKVYEARKRVLGEDHPDTLLSLHSLGMGYSNLGRFDDALATDKLVYEARKRILGEDHPDTLFSLHNLGADYSNLGRFDDALATDKLVYEARKRILGEDHPDTLRSLHGLAADYSDLGKFDDALTADKQVYEARKRVLGEDHPDTLSSLHSLGADYSDLGKFDDALDIKKRVYKARKRVLGEDHPDTLRSLHNLGVDYSNLGRFDDALATDKLVYEARKRVLGEDHPDTLRSLHNLGLDYSKLRRFDDALATDKLVYEARKRVLGEDHPDTLTSLHSLGTDYSKLGRFDDALAIDKLVYEARKRVLGEDHPDTVRSKEEYERIKSFSE